MSQTDYLFVFADEASAKAALPAYWSANPDFVWDLSRVMSPTGNGATAPFTVYMGTDVLDGYPLSLSLTAVDETIWSIPQCMLEGDRITATILRTRLDAAQMLGISVSPVMAGTAYIFAGQNISLILDQSQHPISDSATGILDS